MKYVLFILLVMFAAAGCNQDNERLEQKALVEGRAGSQAAIEAENANLAARVAAMEVDLQKRRRFIDSVTGTYEGTITNPTSESSSIRLIVTSSFPRAPESRRTRTIEELTYELNNLHLNAQVIEWSTLGDGTEVAFGCTFEQVRPNIVDGVIHLMSAECRISYIFSASALAAHEQLPASAQIDADTSRALASDVIDGRVTEISAFVGNKQSNLSSQRFPLRLRR